MGTSITHLAILTCATECLRIRINHESEFCKYVVDGLSTSTAEKCCIDNKSAVAIFSGFKPKWKSFGPNFCKESYLCSSHCWLWATLISRFKLLHYLQKRCNAWNDYEIRHLWLQLRHCENNIETVMMKTGSSMSCRSDWLIGCNAAYSATVDGAVNFSHERSSVAKCTYASIRIGPSWSDECTYSFPTWRQRQQSSIFWANSCRTQGWKNWIHPAANSFAWKLQHNRSGLQANGTLYDIGLPEAPASL